jgi:hypothetical protein
MRRPARSSLTVRSDNRVPLSAASTLRNGGAPSLIEVPIRGATADALLGEAGLTEAAPQTGSIRPRIYVVNRERALPLYVPALAEIRPGPPR